MRSISLLLAFLIITVVSNRASAAPFIPADDATVLERLPFRSSDPTAQKFSALRAELARDPTSLPLAVRLARSYIEQGRAEADPRYNGYAEAVLAPWWKMTTPPAEVLVLRATLRQSRHEFDAALSDLAFVLEQNPKNPQAWVTRALIYQARGEYSTAKQSCLPLYQLSTELVATTCFAGVGSLSGQAEKSFDLLQKTLDRSQNPTGDERLWAKTVLAEIAVRIGRPSAEAHFKEALASNIRDPYLLSAYADFLLDQGRPNDVIDLLSDEVRIDGLFLRLALAEQKIGVLSHHRIEALRARFEASRRRGDKIHQREEAGFTLALLKKPDEALRLAEENWITQREPADARILLESALAANKPERAAPVLKWLKEVGLQDQQLARLVGQLNRLK